MQYLRMVVISGTDLPRDNRKDGRLCKEADIPDRKEKGKILEQRTRLGNTWSCVMRVRKKKKKQHLLLKMGGTV